MFMYFSADFFLTSISLAPPVSLSPQPHQALWSPPGYFPISGWDWHGLLAASPLPALPFLSQLFWLLIWSRQISYIILIWDNTTTWRCSCTLCWHSTYTCRVRDRASKMSLFLDFTWWDPARVYGLVVVGLNLSFLRDQGVAQRGRIKEIQFSLSSSRSPWLD